MQLINIGQQGIEVDVTTRRNEDLTNVLEHVDRPISDEGKLKDHTFAYSPFKEGE